MGWMGGVMGLEWGVDVWMQGFMDLDGVGYSVLKDSIRPYGCYVPLVPDCAASQL